MIQSTDFYLLALQACKPIPWPQFRAEVEADYAATRAPATAAKCRQVMRILASLDIAQAGEAPRSIETTDQLDLVLIQRFVASRPDGSPHTLKSLLMMLRAICSAAEEHRYVTVSPFRLRKLSKWVKCPKPTGKRHNSADEVKAVFDLMRKDIAEKEGWSQWRARRLYAVTATLAYTGLRRNECMLLHVEDIDLDRGIINVVPHTQTGRLKTDASVQPIAIPDALVPILRDWLAHRLDHPAGFQLPPPEDIPWMWPGSLRVGAWVEGVAALKPGTRIRTVAARAGVKMTPQMLRRTWATRAEAIGVTQALLTRQMRHTSERTTKEFYQQRDLDALRQVVSSFDY